MITKETENTVVMSGIKKSFKPVKSTKITAVLTAKYFGTSTRKL